MMRMILTLQGNQILLFEDSYVDGFRTDVNNIPVSEIKDEDENI